MFQKLNWLWLVAIVVVGVPARADEPPVEPSFRSLFNGRDLTGWNYGPVPVAKKPIRETLDGKTATQDGVFAVRDGVVVANGKRVMALYTAQEFRTDFQLRFEFRTTAEKPKNNSGVYIRGPQLQLDAVTEGGLTGVFKKLTQFKPGDWNEIEITVTATTAVCKCNGETLGKLLTVPETGTIGLQSEYGEFEFRRIRIKAEPDRTAAAVTAGIGFLSSQQQTDGSWKVEPSQFQDGVSALCTLALLHSVDAQDDRAKRALGWLRDQKPKGTYALALQTAAFCRAKLPEDLERIRENVAWLAEAQAKDGDGKGGWTYTQAASSRADGSCSRFAIWALDAARRADVPVPEAVWRANAEYWLRSQLDDGGWAYTPTTKHGTVTMTLSGMACLAAIKSAVADETLHKRIDPAVERAWKRHDEFCQDLRPTYLKSVGFRYYAFQLLGQAVQRTGHRKIGEVDVRQTATQLLLADQQADSGSWTGDATFGSAQPLLSTSLALLFLTER